MAYMALEVDLNEDSMLNIKKYKNCVYFSKNQYENILWYFDGRFYFGEWKILLNGEGEKSGKGLEYVPGHYLYKGNFKSGKRNGFGILKLLNK